MDKGKNILHIFANQLKYIVETVLMINYQKKEWPALATEARISAYCLDGRISEYHVMICLTDTRCDTVQQFQRIETTIQLLQKHFRGACIVWKRYFVSDAVNQSGFIDSSDSNSAVSMVQQPPLDGTKVAVWLYIVPNVQLSKEDQSTIMEHASYRHLFHTQLFSSEAGETAQTEALFNQYIQFLAAQKCTLEKNCIRTWVFVQNVDTHYTGMVVARRKCFEREGLTKDTHFIASTGIEGKYTHPDVLVFMDAFAVQGIQPEQIQYLYAPTHLNPTHQYGVTFERGTTIQYGDRKHVYISVLPVSTIAGR